MIIFMVIRLGFSFIGIFLFLFIYWKRLRDDYSDNQIFTSAFFYLLGILSGVVVALFFDPEWWFWLGFLGGVIGVVLVIYKYKLRTLELLETSILSGLLLYGLSSLYDFFDKLNLYSGAIFTVTILLALIFLFLDKHYKEFGWYKSGKIGFSGLVTIGLFFLIRASVALFLDGMLSFVESNTEVIISGTLSFISFLSVYNLSKIKT